MSIDAKLIQFKDLRHLDLSFNELKYLPDFMADFEQLETLNLANNQFNNFPEILSKCKKLKHVNFENNEGLDVPTSFKMLHPNCDVLI